MPHFNAINQKLLAKQIWVKDSGIFNLFSLLFLEKLLNWQKQKNHNIILLHMEDSWVIVVILQQVKKK